MELLVHQANARGRFDSFDSGSADSAFATVQHNEVLYFLHSMFTIYATFNPTIAFLLEKHIIRRCWNCLKVDFPLQPPQKDSITIFLRLKYCNLNFLLRFLHSYSSVRPSLLFSIVLSLHWYGTSTLPALDVKASFFSRTTHSMPELNGN